MSEAAKRKVMSLNANQYAKLVHQGRAKAIGVPWTEEEAKAIADCGNDRTKRDELITKFRAGESVENKPTDTATGEPTPPAPVEKPKRVSKPRVKK